MFLFSYFILQYVESWVNYTWFIYILFVLINLPITILKIEIRLQNLKNKTLLRMLQS